MVSSAAQNITTRVIDIPGTLKRNILSMCRDDDGFLWFRNSQGIWRFDGTGSLLFDRAKFKLKSNVGIESIEAFDHFLLLLDNSNRLHIYDQLNDTAYVFSFNRQLGNLNRTKKKELLFFDFGGQGYFFSRKTLLRKGPDLTKLKGWKKGMIVSASGVDTSNNRISFFLGDWVGFINDDSLVTAGAFNGQPFAEQHKFVITSGFYVTGRYIVITYANGFLIYNKNTLQLLHRYRGADVAGTIICKDSIIFLGRKNAGEFSLADSHSPLFRIENPLFAGDFIVYNILPAGMPGQYIITGDMGLFELTCHQQEKDTYYDRDLLVQAFHNKSIRAILRVDSGLYVGTYSGIYRYDGQGVKLVSPNLVYSAAVEDRHSLLWGIENEAGLVTYNTTTGKTEIPFLGPGTGAIRCFFKYNDGYLGGAENTIFRFNKQAGKWGKYIWLADTALGIVRQINKSNNRWYIATQNGLFTLNENKQTAKIYPKNEGLVVYAFAEVEDGFILATHGKGIVRIDKNGNIKGTYTLKDGLAGDYVYSLVRSGNLLVAGTSAGPSVFLIIGQQLKPLPANGEDINGIFTQECNHGAFFDDTVSRTVILGGLQGLMFIDKDYYTTHANDKPGRVLLSYVKLGSDADKEPPLKLLNYGPGKIVVPSNQSYISLKFAAPLNLSQTKALMRITGINSNWQGFNLSEEINLVALPPGKYVIQARLGESQEESDWFAQTLVVLPAFYQTVVFKAALVLCFLGIIYLFWRSKVKKLEKENLLRAMIASDLHDDIGSTLNSISVYTEILGRQLQTVDDKAKILLDKMGTASRGMIDTMSDIVWAINPKNDDFENVLKRMQFFAGELLGGKNIALHFEADEKARKMKVTMQQRKNIYLIYKEAVNNIFKYSAAASVTATIVKNGNSLVVTIADDGKGFNWEERQKSGNGLNNMQNRAKEMGGKLIIESMPGQGTRVQLSLSPV